MYSSPEAKQGVVGHASDVYAMGLVIWEILLGHAIIVIAENGEKCDVWPSCEGSDFLTANYLPMARDGAPKSRIVIKVFQLHRNIKTP